MDTDIRLRQAIEEQEVWKIADMVTHYENFVQLMQLSTLETIKQFFGIPLPPDVFAARLFRLADTNKTGHVSVKAISLLAKHIARALMLRFADSSEEVVVRLPCYLCSGQSLHVHTGDSGCRQNRYRFKSEFLQEIWATS